MPIGQCKLCLLTKELQVSHLLPAALYRKSRFEGGGNPNPMLITAKATVQTSQEIKDYVLCRECEQLFNRNGERYTMNQVNHRGKFPLLTTLRSQAPSKVVRGFNWYTQRNYPTIDLTKLGYFALSVFWRASVHVWERPSKNESPMRLGPYEESFRKYLLGEADFPQNVALMLVVCTDELSQNTFYIPSRGMKNEMTSHTFQARGLNFMIMVGKGIPDNLRVSCCVTGANKWIMTRSCEDKVAQATRNLLKGRTPVWK